MLTTDDIDAWANHLRYKYGLSAPLDPVMATEEVIAEDGALYGGGDLYQDYDDLTD
jgi:hypothetical protein